MVGAYGLDSIGSEYEPVLGSCEHGIEPSGSIFLSSQEEFFFT
jgi:hypothetical protein